MSLCPDFHTFKKILVVASLLIAARVLIFQRPAVLIEEELYLPPKINFDDISVVKEKYFAVFLIPTLPGKFENRYAIRKTWANITAWSALSTLDKEYTNIKIMFIVGKFHKRPYPDLFLDEVSKHNDILIVSALEEHRTVLKYKVLWGLQRSQHLYDYKFLIKTDDDILVNLPILLKNLKSMNSHKVYGGDCIQRFGGFDGYPSWRYCSGGGYILSYDMVSSLIGLGYDIHKVPFRPEDAYVGWLVYNHNKNMNFTMKVPHGFHHVLKTWGYDCGIYDFWFYHYVAKPKRMISLFQQIDTNVTVECPLKKS